MENNIFSLKSNISKYFHVTVDYLISEEEESAGYILYVLLHTSKYLLRDLGLCTLLILSICEDYS